MFSQILLLTLKSVSPWASFAWELRLLGHTHLLGEAKWQFEGNRGLLPSVFCSTISFYLRYLEREKVSIRMSRPRDELIAYNKYKVQISLFPLWLLCKVLIFFSCSWGLFSRCRRFLYHSLFHPASFRTWNYKIDL